MRYAYLSHVLKGEIPVYGGKASLNIKSIRSISSENYANVFSFEMENHWGTHVDCPAHFFKDGMKVSEYAPETWLFNHPFVLKMPLEQNKIINPEDIGHINEGTDLLLIKSDFSRFRGTERYSNNNPGFTPETGMWLRGKYPTVRAIGFDFISLSPYENRNLGREAHRAFLDPNGVNAPILVIEDMDLSGNLSGLKQVMVFPLRIEGVDSAPCTVIGVLED